ncbi:hypothetical protein DNTS_013882 [Danionella cerebrum]|uniref:FISNA domain-containing protein n=1 Tax=Danionella cerebrum TaxID=2873325 RepID=A0A553QBW1_9TELE|nr:hypothetical protein DNTS_013882 [Danionella translucida]
MDNSVDMEDDDDLPFGRGVSIYGSEDGDGEDVIPQRTLPFTLRYSDPVRTCEERAVSPASSYTSMKSDSLSETGEEHEQSSTVVRLERRDSSALSSDSFISDEDDVAEKDPEQSLRKKSKTENILKQQKAPAPVKPELVVDPNQKRHPAMTVDFAFKALTLCLKKLEEDLKLFKKLLWERYPERFRDPLDGFDLVDLVDKMLELCDIEVSMKIAVALLNFMNAKKLAEYLEGLCKRNEVRYELKLALKRKYEMVCEGYSTHPVPFESVYTELYISNGNEASVNIEHEFRPTIEELKESAKTDPSEYCKGLTSEELLIKLAKLAYGMLEKNEFQIKKKHWQEVGLPDSYPAMVCTSLCMEFYREEHILYTEKVCCFAHPTIQEFMAALHVFYSYKKHGKNVFEPGKRKVLKVSLADVLRSGVDKVLNAENSHFDIFLCFLLGLSVEANQDLLNNLLGITSSSSKNSHEEITHYILKKIKEGNVPEKTETLKRCIDELNPKMQL